MWTVSRQRADNDELGWTDLFLYDKDPSDVGGVNCLDVVRIVNQMWLNYSVVAMNFRSPQYHTDHVGFS